MAAKKRGWCENSSLTTELGGSFSGGTPTRSATHAREGSYAMLFANTSESQWRSGGSWFTSGTENFIYYRVYLYLNQLPEGNNSVIQITDSSDSGQAHMLIDGESEGLIWFWDSEFGSVFPAENHFFPLKEWVCVEFMLKVSSKEFACKINGETIYESSGWKYTANPVQGVRVGWLNGNEGSAKLYMDAIAVNDSTGATDNSWVGETINYSLFKTSTPVTGSNLASINVGCYFTPSQDGYITHVRWYRQSAGSKKVIGAVWTIGGEKLAETAVAESSTTGWNEIALAEPLYVEGGKTYVVSCWREGTTEIPVTTNFWSGGNWTSGQLVAPEKYEGNTNGRYVEASGVEYPTNTLGSNYFTDLTFVPTEVMVEARRPDEDIAVTGWKYLAGSMPVVDAMTSSAAWDKIGEASMGTFGESGWVPGLIAWGEEFASSSPSGIALELVEDWAEGTAITLAMFGNGGNSAAYCDIVSFSGTTSTFFLNGEGGNLAEKTISILKSGDRLALTFDYSKKTGGYKVWVKRAASDNWEVVAEGNPSAWSETPSGKEAYLSGEGGGKYKNFRIAHLNTNLYTAVSDADYSTAIFAQLE